MHINFGQETENRESKKKNWFINGQTISSLKYFKYTWRMDAKIQNNNNTNANRKMIKFLWFFKNFADFSWPLLILVLERNDVASTVIFDYKLLHNKVFLFWFSKNLIHLEHYRYLIELSRHYTRSCKYFFLLFFHSLSSSMSRLWCTEKK